MNPITKLLEAKGTEQVFTARNNGIRRSPMWRLEDFVLVNETLIKKHLDKQKKLSIDEREELIQPVAFNCMVRLYETWISTAGYWKQEMNNLIEK